MTNRNDSKDDEYQNQGEGSCTNREQINTDGRAPYDWQSNYPEDARKEMRFEAAYVAIVLIISVAGLIFLLLGVLQGECAENSTLSNESVLVLQSILVYFFSGLLGGTVYGMKYFYRVVARGYWSQDRRYWRLFSPWISSCVALVVGCMATSGFIKSVEALSTLTSICVGFVAGYFADDAVSKMSEVAKALFGTSSNAK